jgi:hypothetical protein
MPTKNHFQTDADDLYIGPVICQSDPEDETRFMVPFGAYEDEPPPVEAKQIQKRNAAKTGWDVIPDHRGEVYWLADRTRHQITAAGATPPAEALGADPGPTAEQIAAANVASLKAQAQLALDKSDVTVGRCYEAQVPVPDAWKAYRAALRAIVTTGAGALPERPAYPAGT